MITEAIQITELSQMYWMEKQKNVKICVLTYIYIYLRIFNNRQQKNVLLIVHIS